MHLIVPWGTGLGLNELRHRQVVKVGPLLAEVPQRLLGHGGEARPTYVLEVAEQRLPHLLHVIWTFIHVLVREEAAPLKHNLLIHFLVVLELGKLFLHLVQLDLKVVRLLLPERQLFVDVGLKSVVRSLNLVLCLLITCMVAA